MTYSIVAHCPRSGMLGVAVATAVPAVGALCPYAKTGIGAVSTQSWVNPYLAIDALHLMEEGQSGPEALKIVMAADEGREMRQIGVIDAQGRSAAWSGKNCTDWFGQIVEPHFAVQGNMLVSAPTIEEMAKVFRASEGLDLAERLMLAMEAGEAAGGDKRGRQVIAGSGTCFLPVSVNLTLVQFSHFSDWRCAKRSVTCSGASPSSNPSGMSERRR